MASNVVTQVWAKATYVDPTNETNGFRKDACGAWIRLQDYGNRDSAWGWEIDHISPGGPDILSNLRPLHWKNNCAKSDGRLSCAVRAQSTVNVLVQA